MSIRSADATLKGYFYQFNNTIEEILSAKKENDLVVVEGIEDIDIHSVDGVRSVQCKYYSSQSLTNSAIREPIMLMLDHFKSLSDNFCLSAVKFVKGCALLKKNPDFESPNSAYTAFKYLNLSLSVVACK